MKYIFLLGVALCAATIADARETKKPKKETSPPPAAGVPYENEDARMGEVVSEACLADPAEGETYDGRDNLLIVSTADGGSALLHFSGQCTFNVLMFAQSYAVKGGGCAQPGSTLLIGGFGAPTECVVSQVNLWHPERGDILLSPEESDAAEAAEEVAPDTDQ